MFRPLEAFKQTGNVIRSHLYIIQEKAEADATIVSTSPTIPGCEEVKDIAVIAQISKVSLRRNDGVSDSSVYLIIVIRYQEENKTVHFYSKSGSPALVTREWLISLEGDMQNSVPGRGKKDLLFNFNLINRSRITKVY